MSGASEPAATLASKANRGLLETIAGVLALTLVASPHVLLAQSGRDPETTNTEEVIVEAIPLPTSVDEVPGGASVIDELEIQRARQQLGLDESLARVPGVFLQNRYNFAQDLRVSIRGFGARANFGIRGVKILVDGIPETTPDGQGQVDSIDLGTVRRIEVIRGPSSSLYGNASGGVLSILTEDGPSTPFVGARLSSGAYGFRKVQTKAGGRNGSLGYLLGVSHSRMDGYRDHSETENLQFTARVDADLLADSTLLAVVQYTDQPVSNDAGGIDADQVAADPRMANDLNVTFEAGEALEQKRLGLVYELPFGESHRLTVSGYIVDRDFSNKLPFESGGAGELDRLFLGGRVSYAHSLALGGNRNEAIVGLDFESQDDDRRRFDNSSGQVGELTFDQDERVRARSVFARDRMSLDDDFSLTLGLRYDEVSFDVHDRFLADGDDTGRRTLDEISPMVGFLAELHPSLAVYGNYSTAFETPTTTEFANPTGEGGFNPELDPQFAKQLEVGIRGRWSDTRWEAAVFSTDVEGELVPFEIPGSPGRSYFTNAGKSDRRGLELLAETRLVDRLDLVVSYTYSDFSFTRFVDGDGVDFSGNHIPGIPRHLLYGEVSYDHPSGWFAGVDVLLVDELQANNANSAVSPGHQIANLRAGLDVSRGPVTFSPFIGVNNVFDETYSSNLRINAFGGRYFEPGPERNGYVGLEVRYEFR